MTKGYQSQNSCSFSPFILWKERNLQVASFTNCLCFSLSNSPFATCLCRALLSVVYTEDIKWPAFTKILELLLHAEVPLSQRLCREIRRYQRGGGDESTNDCGVSLSQNNAVTLVHYVIRDENLLVEMCYIAISFVLPLIWEQKAISSFATFAWVMIDISIPVMELLTVSFEL